MNIITSDHVRSHQIAKKMVNFHAIVAAWGVAIVEVPSNHPCALYVPATCSKYLLKNAMMKT